MTEQPSDSEKPLIDELKETAKIYYDLGLNIVPLKLSYGNPSEHKKPLVEWKRWLEQRQTPEEFEALPFDRVQGFAIICGQKMLNGYYVGVVDLDTKKLNEDIIERGKQLFKTLPITQLEETGNKGLHYVYFSRVQPKTISDYHDVCALELLGTQKICIMAPSEGYTRMNDNTPTEVENIEATFLNVLDRAGILVRQEVEQQQEQAQNSLLRIEKLLDLSKLNKIGEFEYQGQHPYHDSTTEKNFCVNTKTNSWYCFRHNTGGGPLQLLAIKEKVLECGEVKKGSLKGARFRKVLQLAISEGLIDKTVMEETEINPVLIAKDILQEHKFIVDDETDKLYFYDKRLGIYSDKTKRLIKREIAKYLDENSRARYYVDVEDYIRHTAPIVEINKEPEIIAVENGLLNVLTRELQPFSLDKYITVKLPVKYDPQATCPKTMKFLEEVMDEEQRMLTQEHIGYCLHRKILWHLALMLVGTGANGKSVFIDLNTALLGKENVTHQTIQNLCYNRFAVAELHNKLANFSADLPSDVLQHTGRFKELVAGDRQTGEHKFQDPFYFVPYTKFMWSCNAIPSIKATEDNDAYYRRWAIVRFTRQFIGKNDDKTLRDKLRTPEELSGYLNYALDGLKRLMEKGDFSHTMTLEETRQTYIKQSDSAKAFIISHVEITDDYTDFVFHDVLYREYITYCLKEKLPKQPKGALTKSMQENCPGAEHTKIRPEKNESPVSAWRYVKVKQPEPEHPEKQLGEKGLDDYPYHPQD